MGRDTVHRHRLSEGVLPEVPPVQPVLPAHGTGTILRHDDRLATIRRGAWRAPTARHAPRRVAAKQMEDSHALPSDPDQQHGRLHREKETPPREALPTRTDAGTAARLQPHLYRLRSHPRILNHHQGEAERRAVP